MKKILTILLFATSCFVANAFAAPSDTSVCSKPFYAKVIVTDSFASYIAVYLDKSAKYEIQYYNVNSNSPSGWDNLNYPTYNYNNDTILYYIPTFPCQISKVRARAICSDSITTEWKTIQFLSSGCPKTCQPIQNLHYTSSDSIVKSSLTNNFGYLDWSDQNRTDYVIQYKLKNNPSTLWIQNPDERKFDLSKLESCQIYSSRVISSCTNQPNVRDTSGIIDFKTPCYNKISCDTPSIVVTDSHPTLTYKIKPNEQAHYAIQYKLTTDSAWINRDTFNLYSGISQEGFYVISLENLKLCKNYTIRARNTCAANNNWIISNFKSSGCQPLCKKIDAITYTLQQSIINGQTSLDADIDWSGKSDSFTIQYKQVNSSNWVNNNRNNPFISRLNDCSSYDVRIINLCNSSSDEIINDTSKVFNMLVQYDRCSSGYCKKISSAEIKTINDNTVIVNWNSTSTTDYVIMYRTGDDSFIRYRTTSDTFIILKDLPLCKRYLVSITSFCDYNSYTFQTTFSSNCLSPMPVVCSDPYGIRLKFSNDTTVIPYWWAKGDRHFELQYRIKAKPENVWQNISVSDTFTTLNNLQRCATYQLRLIASCDTTGNWLYYEFKTPGTCPLVSGCATPLSLQTSFNGDSTFVSWQYPPSDFNAQRFEVQYKASTDAGWSANGITSSTSTTILKQSYCTEYHVRVRTYCSSAVYSDWAEYVYRAGNRCFLRPGGYSSFKNSTALSGILVKPNPSSTQPTVSFKLTDSRTNVSIKVLNSLGSTVLVTDLGNLNAGDYEQSIIEAVNLTAGFYFITVQAENEVPLTTRWVKL